ncbi:MAG: hypothetical protein AAF125_19055, partial [Chloroflexota bacterium]
FDNYLQSRFRAFTGYAYWLWGAVMAFTVWLIWRWHKRRRLVFFLVVWGVGSVLFSASFGVTYGMLSGQWWWYLTLWLALLLGLGLSVFPAFARWLFFGYLATLLFVPIYDQDLYYLGREHFPFEDVFEVLADEWQTGDVLYLDANCPIGDPSPIRRPTCGSPEEWDYYQMVYFPNGEMTVVHDPSGHRGVWYVHDLSYRDDTSFEQVSTGRLPSKFIGPHHFLFYLYEAPPDPEGILFDNGMRFHGVDVLDPHLGGNINRGFVTRREGEPLELRLWWSTSEAIGLDYSVSIQIARDATDPALTQWDGSPMMSHLQITITDPLPDHTSGWTPNEIYVQTLRLDVPSDVPFDMMFEDSWLYVLVYQSWDGEVMMGEATESNGRLPVQRLRFLSY